MGQSCVNKQKYPDACVSIVRVCRKKDNKQITKACFFPV